MLIGEACDETKQEEAEPLLPFDPKNMEHVILTDAFVPDFEFDEAPVFRMEELIRQYKSNREKI